MPRLVDLSCLLDHHSASSLVAQHLADPLQLSEVQGLARKVAILRKKDVWDYAIPEEWAHDAECFDGFIQSRTDGPYGCTVELMNEFFDNINACLIEGEQAIQDLQLEAQRLYSG